MTLLARAVAFAKIANYFELQGYSIEEVSEYDLISDIVKESEKPYLSSFSAPDFNDFTEQNSLWLVLRLKGKPVYLGCARLEDLESESFGKYFGRLVKRHHGPDVSFSTLDAEIEKLLKGKLVYFGDLFVSKSARGPRSRLRAFLALAHLAVSLKWNPDWTYCFIREAHIMRGSAALYGFTKTFCRPIHWDNEPPAPRDESDWLVALPKQELLPTTQNTIERICLPVTSDDQCCKQK